ncbi:MAG: hypothetical protein HY289_06080 [Planctomycetes bacterium]|nr:hypothetical protein [Planctomycetota bacterium]
MHAAENTGDNWMKFYIGSVLGGPEISRTPIDTFISRVARASLAYQESHDISSAGGLDIVYHVPGGILQPEFEGLRTAKFSKKDRMLMVQISVPTLFDNERHLENFLVESLRDAIQLAKPIFKAAEISFSPEEYLRLVDALETTTISR